MILTKLGSMEIECECGRHHRIYSDEGGNIKMELNTKEVKMAKAVTCPVCNGEGTIPSTDYSNYTTGFPSKKTCHGCGGKGWVEVSEDHDYYKPPATIGV